MSPNEEFSQALVAIRTGDVETVQRLIAANPGFASSRFADVPRGRSPLHMVTDWPGYFPNGPRITKLLLDAGADPNVRANADGSGETPLHWAASSDDADVAAVLIEGGADLEAADGSIGTPLANAVGYACWHVARLLVASGARVDALWLAGALGMLDRLEELVATPDGQKPEAISQAFWHACAGGQRRAAERLLALGADLNWVPEYASGTPLDAAQGGGTRQGILIDWLESQGARAADSDR